MAWCSHGSYETVKYVQIKDARLGYLRLVLLLTIAGYVIVIEMFQLGGYLESSPVVGVVGFSLQQPTLDDCDPSMEGCTNAFLPLDTLPYCQQAIGSSNNNNNNVTKNYVGSVYPCQIYEAVNAQVVRETSMVVWTRAATSDQILTCDGSTSTTCPHTYENLHGPPRKFYVAQSEAFTVSLEHAVTASRICESHGRRRSSGGGGGGGVEESPHYACSAQASRYRGRLYSTDDRLCSNESYGNNSFAEARGSAERSAAPCFVGANRTSDGRDFFSLGVLLRAAGVSLDDRVAGGGGRATYRESGATLLLKVVWNDFRPFRGLAGGPFYYYSPQLIGTSYKESVPFYDSYRGSRTLMRGHGIKIAVLLTGNFHRFQILSFLITLTTALGLLALATTVVDSLMLHVLPEKERYQQVKYETIREDSVEFPPPSTLLTSAGDDRDRSDRSNHDCLESDDTLENTSDLFDEDGGEETGNVDSNSINDKRSIPSSMIEPFLPSER